MQHSHTCPIGIPCLQVPPDTSTAPPPTQYSSLDTGPPTHCSPSLKFASKHTHIPRAHLVWGRYRHLVHPQQPAPGTWTVTHGPTLAASTEPCICLTHPSPPGSWFSGHTPFLLQWLATEDPRPAPAADAEPPLNPVAHTTALGHLHPSLTVVAGTNPTHVFSPCSWHSGHKACRNHKDNPESDGPSNC